MWCDTANALTCRHTTVPSQFSFVSHIQVHCSVIPLKLQRSNLQCDKNITSPIFDVHRAVHRNIISIVKPTRCTNVSNLFHFGMTLYMFRMVLPSIISSSRLYIQQQAYVRKQNLASRQQSVSVWQIPVAVCTVLNSWWWTEKPSETCRVSF